MKIHNKKDHFQYCPICGREIEYNPHYPRYICNDCVSLAKGANGEHVVFFHALFIGDGLKGYYRQNNYELVPFNGNSCFIHGKKCTAVYDHTFGMMMCPVTVGEPTTEMV